jgi:hypothetical protein
MKRFELPKGILNQMTPGELKTFALLKKQDLSALEDMEKKQRKYTQVSRKMPNSKTLPALLKAGFDAEGKVVRASDKVKSFMAKMIAKY